MANEDLSALNSGFVRRRVRDRNLFSELDPYFSKMGDFIKFKASDSNYVIKEKKCTSNVSLQWFFYVLLFLMPFVSLSFFLLSGFGYFPSTWHFFYKVYVVVALAYIWFIYILLFIEDFREKKYPSYDSEKISVVIPCFNEEASLLRRCIKSVVNAKGNKEIILINDGSTNDIEKEIIKLKKEFTIKTYTFKKNKGKRAAMHYAIKYLLAEDSKFIVTTDSDTVFDKRALVKLVEPLKYKKIAAASGDVQLLNVNQNWLTKMVDAYYWSALNMQRKAESALGMVGCCSGAIAAYRTYVMRDVIDEFLQQKFFGHESTYGEDRHLTNLVLKKYFNVAFVSEAVAFTQTPATIRAFLKQQLRWRRGYLKESLFALSYTWKVRPLLFAEILIWNLFLSFASLGVALLVLANILVEPLFFLYVILPSWIFLMIVRHIPMFFHARDKILGLFLFTMFSNFVLYWQSLYALFTLREKKWITR